jgi:hypothetical protein
MRQQQQAMDDGAQLVSAIITAVLAGAGSSGRVPALGLHAASWVAIYN